MPAIMAGMKFGVSEWKLLLFWHNVGIHSMSHCSRRELVPARRPPVCPTGCNQCQHSAVLFLLLQLIEDLRKQLEHLQLFKLECEQRRGRSSSMGLQEYNSRTRETELEQEIKQLKQVGEAGKGEETFCNKGCCFPFCLAPWLVGFSLPGAAHTWSILLLLAPLCRGRRAQILPLCVCRTHACCVP